MTVLATAQWWVRADGAETNGGGYDSAIASAGTNYCDQASGQLTLTDLATSGAGVAVITSATGGFTAAMIGNCIRISAGTNFQTGYYFVTGYTDTNTVTVDRTPSSAGAGSAGSGILGGAHASIINYTNGGTGATPAIATPLVAGNIINVRGSGTDDPTTEDYDWSGASNNEYWTMPSGSSGVGLVRIIGYNGRPLVGYSGLLLYNTSYCSFEDMSFKVKSAIFTSYGILSGESSLKGIQQINCYLDQAGFDVSLTTGTAINCRYTNSGATTGGSNFAAISHLGVENNFIMGNFFKDIRGGGIEVGYVSSVINNIVYNCRGNTTLYGIYENSTFVSCIIGNTVDNCQCNGIGFGVAKTDAHIACFNNCITNNAGYGLHVTPGATAVNDSITSGRFGYNNSYNNGFADFQGITARSTDLSVDPSYKDAANGNFSVGTSMKALGFPNTYLGAPSTISYVDIGAVQRIEPSSGGGGGEGKSKYMRG